MRKASIMLVPVLLGVALLAGCGGGDDTSSTATALTKAEFLKQGNAICAKGNKEINKAADQIFTKNKQPTDAQFNEFATKTAIPVIQTEIDGLGALSAPSGDEATVKKIVDTAQADLDKAKADPKALNSNKLFDDANKLANSYGLTTCGNG
jgi:hypothetical protein